MSSKFRKTMKVLPNVFMVLGAVSVAFAMLLSLVNIPVNAQGGNPDITCPSGGGWDKVDLPSDTYYQFTYNAPDDKLIAGSCWKSATTRDITYHDPAVSSVTFTNTQYLSHYSVLLIDKPLDPTPTEPTPTEPTPTEPTATPADPSPTPDPSETPADPSPTPDPSVTPEPLVTPDPTEDPDEPTPVPTYSPPSSSDNPSVLIPVTGFEFGSPMNKAQSVAFNLGLGFLGVGLVLQALRKKIK